MERLTKRDGKGRAYFDDDGSLIRGANGTFHQKKDMTAQYIHDRFVALDKTIDRLAVYEDTGLEPEEIKALVAPPNTPLTLEELREMDGEPVWVGHPLSKSYGAWAIIDLKFDMCRVAGGGIAVFENCGKTWIAYRRKPEEVN